MKKIIALILIIWVSISMLEAQCLNNPSLTQGTITPTPLAPGGTGTLSLFFEETMNNYTDDENSPISITLCLLNNTAPNGTGDLGGTYSSFFTWAFDPGINCFFGIQNQDILLNQGGTITVNFTVTNPIACPTNQIGFTSNLQPAPCMNGNNDTNDDSQSFYTCVASCLLTATTTETSPISCNGDSDGEATTVGSSGTTPYQYTWDAATGNQTTATATGLGVGTYLVTVSDSEGCSVVDSITLTEPDLLMVAAVIDKPIGCSGSNDGVVSAAPSGGNSPYFYTWDNGGITSAISNLGPGTYIVTVVDNSGCTATAEATLSDPIDLAVDVELVEEISCNGESDGSAIVNVTGGTMPYTYNWDNGETTQTASGLDGGLQMVTVTDAGGCSGTGSILMGEPMAVTVAATLLNDPDCAGSANGSAEAAGSGGTAPYTYEWDNGESTAIATMLNAGMHIVTVTDANTCMATASVTLTDPGTFTVTVPSGVLICNGASDGTVTATPVGGDAPYDYSWSNGGTTDTATGLSAGTYEVTVTDSNGCFATGSTQIFEQSPINIIDLSITNTSCGSCVGAVDILVSGSVPPYSYLWSDGATTEDRMNLCAGVNSVTITDSEGCTATRSYTIDDDNDFAIDSVTIDEMPSCAGNCDAAATVSTTAGQAPFSYTWNNGSVTATASGLCAGTYMVTVIDNNGCLDVGTVTIMDPIAILVTTVVDEPLTCSTPTSGVATATATNGVSPYSYQWSNGSMTATNTGLSAGMYTVTATDADGCSATGTVTVVSPVTPELSVVLENDVTCAGGSDGSATASGTGGTPPYTYEWDNGETSATATMLTAGAHVVTLTDAGGCTKTGSMTIAEADAILVSVNVVNEPSCPGNSDGSAEAIGMMGTAPYTYVWDNGETSSTATMLAAGAHIVTATDANGCTGTGTVTLVDPLPFTVTLPGGILICSGASDGMATATPVGGSSPFMYDWSNGDTVDTATGLSVGTYTVTVTDLGGCTATASTQVFEQSPINVIVLSSTNTVCGACIGTADLLVSGSVPPYSYLWSDGGTTEDRTNLCAGINTITITDSQGCIATASVDIQDDNSFGIDTITIDQEPTCVGSCDGIATVVLTSGTPPFSYQWDAGASSQTTPTATGLCAGTYFVTATDGSECRDVSMVTITDPAPIQVSVMLDIDVSCSSSTTGQVTASASVGTAPYMYQWDASANNQMTATATGLGIGVYDVSVTDANGCTATGTITIGGNGPDICVLIDGDPNHPLATEDCDNGGVPNYEECVLGNDPYDPTDDYGCPSYPCAAAEAGEIVICDVLLLDPTNTLATLDCDGGGVSNLDECNGGGDPLNPDDDCTVAANIGLDICAILSDDPTNALGQLDCDGGGVINAIECASGENPLFADDDCIAALDESLYICGLLSENGVLDPTAAIALADCDGGGIDNYTECINGGNPSDPIDDCQVILEAGLNICQLASDPNSPIAMSDCDGDGVANATECSDGTDPADPCSYEDGSITLPITADQTNCPDTSPDLSPVATVVPSNIQGISALAFVVNVNEVNGFPTTGAAMIVRVPSDPRFTFTYDPNATAIGGAPVDNSDWTYLGNNGIVHQFLNADVLPANGISSFGWNGLYDPQATDGQTTITATIVPTSGGETNFLNNTDSERLVYFK